MKYIITHKKVVVNNITIKDVETNVVKTSLNKYRRNLIAKLKKQYKTNKITMDFIYKTK